MERERLTHAELVAFGMTRRKGVTADDDASLRVLADCFAGTVTIVGKTWGLHLSQGAAREPRREPAHDRRLGALPGRRRASGSSTTPSTSSTPTRDDADYALRRVRAAAEAGAAVVCLCDTNGASLPPLRRAPWSARSRRRSACRSACTSTTTATAPWPTASSPSTPAPRQVQGTMNGYGERCGNANLVSIIPALELKMGLPVVSDEQLERLTETAHFVADVVNVAALGAPAVRGPHRLRPQGRPARGRRRAGAADLRARRPGARSATSSASSSRELSGKGAVLRKAHEIGLRARGRRRARGRASSSASRSASTTATTTRPPTPRSSCCCATSWRRTSRSSASRASA